MTWPQTNTHACAWQQQQQQPLQHTTSCLLYVNRIIRISVKHWLTACGKHEPGWSYSVFTYLHALPVKFSQFKHQSERRPHSNNVAGVNICERLFSTAMHAYGLTTSEKTRTCPGAYDILYIDNYRKLCRVEKQTNENHLWKSRLQQFASCIK